MQAAGGPLEHLWARFAVHHTNHVLSRLQAMRVGRLKDEHQLKRNDISNPYINEPERHPDLTVLSGRPFDCSTPMYALHPPHFFTPNELFYVRNHLPVPETSIRDPSSFELTVGIDLGGGAQDESLSESESSCGADITLSLEDLKTKFKPATIDCTLQCTGNRGHEMTGEATNLGQISNARWRGVLLRDVLLRAGVSEDSCAGLHVHFEGLDGYEVSIPCEKAMRVGEDVLLAYDMNGEPLSADHGAPLRVVVPGFVGARSVKWVSNIQLRGSESASVWHRRYYRVFPPDTRDISQINYADNFAPAIYGMPVQSTMVTPVEGQWLAPGQKEVTVKGYALSGGGNRVVKVMVSADDGHSWTNASLMQEQEDAAGTGGTHGALPPLQTLVGRQPTRKPGWGRHWTWSLWSANIVLPEGHVGEVRLCCKAVDEAYNTQPETVDHIWNLRGYLSNAWSRVKVFVPPPPQ